jgi:hypothetical protein
MLLVRTSLKQAAAHDVRASVHTLDPADMHVHSHVTVLTITSLVYMGPPYVGYQTPTPTATNRQSLRYVVTYCSYLSTVYNILPTNLNYISNQQVCTHTPAPLTLSDKLGGAAGAVDWRSLLSQPYAAYVASRLPSARACESHPSKMPLY